MTEKQMVNFYRNCNFREVNVLIVENTSDQVRDYERKVVVDNEFIDKICEKCYN